MLIFSLVHLKLTIIHSNLATFGTAQSVPGVATFLKWLFSPPARADHSASYEKVTLSDLTRLEAGSADEVEDNEKTSLPTIKESET